MQRKKFVVALLFLSLMALVIAACGSGGNATTGSANGNAGGTQNATVHLNDTNFAQSSVTISKGSTITLVDDTTTLHIIANGSWVNGNAQPMQEQGMPNVNNVQISSGSQIIGPFMTAGTFHLYCTVHPGMNLTVIVQ